MTRNSIFLDRGSDLLVLHPSVLSVDRRGNTRAHATGEPIEIWATRSKDRSSIAELPGTIENKVEKFYYRGPVDLENTTWDRVEWNGEAWDMAVPPHKSGWGRTTHHWEIVLRSRNQAVPDG